MPDLYTATSNIFILKRLIYINEKQKNM